MGTPEPRAHAQALMTSTSPSKTSLTAGKAPEPRLYVILRADLPSGLLLAQTAHVVRKFTRRFPSAGVLKGGGQEREEDEDEDESLIVLCEADERALHDRYLFLRWEAPLAPIVEFREPDLDDGLTAIAVHGGTTPETSLLLRRLLSSLPLALREARSSMSARARIPAPELPCHPDTPTG